MNTLQKALVSATAILSFGFYSFFLRTQDAQLSAVAPVVATLNTAQQNAASGATPPSSDFQTYVAEINAAAAKYQAAQQTQPAVTAGSGEDGQEGGEGRRSQVVAQNTAPAPASQPTAAQTQAQQAAQLAAQQQAAAQAQAAQLAAQQQAAAQAAAQSTGQYKNGTYTGPSVNVYYGYVQVQAVIQGGQLANVIFLQYPSDRSTSRYINSQAMPLLTQEAIQAQSASVSGVSGASDTSQGFIQSLGSALAQAHV